MCSIQFLSYRTYWHSGFRFPNWDDWWYAYFIDRTFIELNSGDGLVLYNNGILEAFDINKKQYGMERLCEIISHNWQHSAQEIKQAVIDDVRKFIGEQKVFDDITLVVLKQQ